MSASYSLPTELVWLPGQGGNTKDAKLGNTGTNAFEWTVDPMPNPATMNGFQWGQLTSWNLLPAGYQSSAVVRVTLLGNPPAAEQLTFRFREPVSHAPAGQAVVTLRDDGVALINPGDLRISSLQPNPPGDDMVGEGEYLEITNLTNGELNFTGTGLWQFVFDRAGKKESRELVRFKPDPTRFDFGRTCRLPAAGTLRVLTRGTNGDDAFNRPDFARRHYLGRSVAVWNNTGDRAWLDNDFKQLLDSVGYGSEAAPAPRPAPNPVVVPPVPPTISIRFPRAIIPANAIDWTPIGPVQDGDVLAITTTESTVLNDWRNGTYVQGAVSLGAAQPLRTPSGLKLALSRGVQPVGPSDLAPAGATPFGEFLLPGVPKGGLLGRLGNEVFFVGAGLMRRVTLNRTETLFLTVNDTGAYRDIFQNWILGSSDNSGSFSVDVVLIR